VLGRSLQPPEHNNVARLSTAMAALAAAHLGEGLAVGPLHLLEAHTVRTAVHSTSSFWYKLKFFWVAITEQTCRVALTMAKMSVFCSVFWIVIFVYESRLAGAGSRDVLTPEELQTCYRPTPCDSEHVVYEVGQMVCRYNGMVLTASLSSQTDGYN
jgi:hypothetical protein